MRYFNVSEESALTSVEVDWGGLSVTQSPTILPPIFYGDPYYVMGIINQKIARKISSIVKFVEHEVQLKAVEDNGTPVSFKLKLDCNEASIGKTIHRIAVQELLRLVQVEPVTHYARECEDNGNKEEAIQLSTSYGIVSKYTRYQLKVQF